MLDKNFVSMITNYLFIKIYFNKNKKVIDEIKITLNILFSWNYDKFILIKKYNAKVIFLSQSFGVKNLFVLLIF